MSDVKFNQISIKRRVTLIIINSCIKYFLIIFQCYINLKNNQNICIKLFNDFLFSFKTIITFW